MGYAAASVSRAARKPIGIDVFPRGGQRAMHRDQPCSRRSSDPAGGNAANRPNIAFLQALMAQGQDIGPLVAS